MSEKQTVYVGSPRPVLRFAALLIATGTVMALVGWSPTQALRHGQWPGDLRPLLIGAGGIAAIALGCLLAGRLLCGGYRLLLSDTGIEQSTPFGRRFARWTSLGRFELNRTSWTLCAEVTGPDADAQTRKAGKFFVYRLPVAVDLLTLWREIEAYQERALM